MTWGVAQTRIDGPLLDADAPIADGAWCWFADPRALVYNGAFYLGYLTSLGDVKISRYAIATKTWTHFTLRSRLQVDDHANPAILIRQDGRIMAFYSQHDGGAIYQRISTNPEDITAFGAETNIVGGPGQTYPNPVLMTAEANRIYMTFRGGTYEPAIVYSDNGGTSWTTQVPLVDAEPAQRPYVKVACNGTRMDFICTRGHPRTIRELGQANHVYHFYLSGGSFYKSDGTLIKTLAAVVGGSPLALSDLTMIWDGTTAGGWVWDIAYGSDGRPVATFATFPTLTDHRYKWARWTGSAWSVHEICTGGGFLYSPSEGEYSGGVMLDHSDTNTVFVSRGTLPDHEIERYVTADNGTSWGRTVITSNSSGDQVRPVVVRGHVTGAPTVVWMDGNYASFTEYYTAMRCWPPFAGSVA